MTGKTIGLEGRLYDYYAAHAYREPEILTELRAETARLGGLAQMQIGPEQGAFMAMVVKLMGAKRILELGTFTGYSSLGHGLDGRCKDHCRRCKRGMDERRPQILEKGGR